MSPRGGAEAFLGEKTLFFDLLNEFTENIFFSFKVLFDMDCLGKIIFKVLSEI